MMSMDIVDDLHAAEDALGETRAALRALVLLVETAVERPMFHRAPTLRANLLERVHTSRVLLADEWCRPTCDDDGCADDCGCPHHERGD